MRLLARALIPAAFLCSLTAQNPPLQDLLLRRGIRIAIPDFRCSGQPGSVAAIFNKTLDANIRRLLFINAVGKGLYPRNIPQQPADIRKSAPAEGLALADWAAPPINAGYLVVGYLAAYQERLSFYVWIYDVGIADPARAQIFRKRYVQDRSEHAARDLAHQFAADLGASGSPLPPPKFRPL